jgi:urease accessory protein
MRTGTAIRMDMCMPTDGMRREPPGSSLAQLRLMQLISPALPIGGFTYSQGLEYAVEAAWVRDLPSLQDWLQGLIEDSVACLEIPVLARLYHACVSRDVDAIDRWGRFLLASRETRELRLEEQQRARALTRLLTDLDIPEARYWQSSLHCCQAAPYALAVVNWGIPLGDAALGYAWSWLENMVAAAIKLVPLGQTDGQRVQLALAESLPRAVQRGLALEDDQIGASAPAMALASSLHETQYTRLFRS